MFALAASLRGAAGPRLVSVLTAPLKAVVVGRKAVVVAGKGLCNCPSVTNSALLKLLFVSATSVFQIEAVRTAVPFRRLFVVFFKLLFFKIFLFRKTAQNPKRVARVVLSQSWDIILYVTKFVSEWGVGRKTS